MAVFYNLLNENMNNKVTNEQINSITHTVIVITAILSDSLYHPKGG